MRIKKSLKKEIEKAEKKARKEVLKPKKKIRVKSVSKEQGITGGWVDDVWGEQGQVFFDGKFYWIVELVKKRDDYESRNRALSNEEWVHYKQGNYEIKEHGYEFGRRSMERGRDDGTTGHKQGTVKSSSLERRPTNGKTRKQKSVSRNKPTKVAKRKGKWLSERESG